MYSTLYSLRTNICRKNRNYLSKQLQSIYFSSSSSTNNDDVPIRVRYAPSPTGFLHLGGLRTALYNYLFAKKNNGKFLLRIEDTDQSRQVDGSIEKLISALQLCGVHYDEGPALPYTSKRSNTIEEAQKSYIQSERLPIYREYAHQLLECGHSYRCFCTQERLVSLREAQLKKGNVTSYDRACSHISKSESDIRAQHEPYVIRMRVPQGTSSLSDLVLGDVKFSHSVVDDQVLLKSDGFPTYHLASVVDDHLMDISHVIRGQEWLASTPKHLLLYNFLGWRAPRFAHLPLLLNEDRTKLSKRHGDAAVEDFIASGYIPSALVNFVSLLGWTPPVGQPEVLTMDELIPLFSLDHIHKGNAVVNRARLDFFNSSHIKRKVDESLKINDNTSIGIDNNKDIYTSIHAYVLPKLIQTIQSLHSNKNKDKDNSDIQKYIDNMPIEYKNLIFACQCERVGPLSDFIPITLPFFVKNSSSNDNNNNNNNSSYYKQYIVSKHTHPAWKKVIKHVQKDKSFQMSEIMSKEDISEEILLEQMKVVFTQYKPFLQLLVTEWKQQQQQQTSNNNNNTDVPHYSSIQYGKDYYEILQSVVKELNTSTGKILFPLRWILTGIDVGATHTDTIRLLGVDECISRIEYVLSVVDSNK